MDVIPVIDIKDGQVVHARGGRRDAYRPIQTPLAVTSAPADVAAGLLRTFPFRQLYIADLDAIEHRHANDAALDAIASVAVGVELWVDSGISDKAAAQSWLARRTQCLVIGSESQSGPETCAALREQHRILLSLDFRGDQFDGPPVLVADPALWPARVIVMTLARVGGAAGPDTARVADIILRAGGKRVFAAGGVRNGSDLESLATSGAAGVLVATALHTGGITGRDLERVMS